ncbi:hypothetical protein [Massilia sp. CF038]|uniref:hypothetical protein n=1 Tax=Massilia sp. CF038 TaxID=1881045 RepID=UPI000917AD7F|nr:hypothetical protein [Massilia sp. CF038]SHG37711.1 hypothetical protein SAMN05428948_0153 [Massilia sp. CF038]
MTKANLALATLASAIALCYAPLASAQQSNMNTISVDVSGVASAVAKKINVDASKIPTTVQAPVEVAASACGVEASTLTQQGGSGTPGTCQAKTSSAALEQLIQKQVQAAK